MNDVSTLLIGLIFGSIGVGYCIYGRKQKNTVAFWAGVALMGLPYVIENNMGLIIGSLGLMFLPRFLKL